MKKLWFGIIILAVIVAAGALYFYNKDKDQSTADSQLTSIRVGWQTPWATQGQLTQVLKHTDTLKNNNLSADFKGFDSGAPLNEAALAGGVDVLFTADQPAATLLAKNQDWLIIGRLMYNRVSLYVPPKSTISSIGDLKGKTVAMPFGAAAQRMALKQEKDAGLNPSKDVTNINLGIYEQSDLVKDASLSKWGTIDAMAGFDPTPAIFEEKGYIRMLHTENVVSAIVMSKKYIADNPDAPTAFLASVREAYNYYSNNTEQANNWFIDEAKLNISQEALAISASVEPNTTAKSISDVRLSFNDSDYQIMQEAADFIYDQKLVTKKVTMKDYIDLSYLEKVK